MSPADILWVGVAVVDDVAYPMQGLVTPQRGSHLVDAVRCHSQLCYKSTRFNTYSWSHEQVLNRQWLLKIEGANHCIELAKVQQLLLSRCNNLYSSSHGLSTWLVYVKISHKPQVQIFILLKL